MFAITGVTGQVGGAVARTLLTANQPVRAVVRDARKGKVWTESGCAVGVADIGDSAALAAAFADAEGVFLMVPPNFDPMPGFPEAQAMAATLLSAINAAKPGHVVYLSTIGAQATETNLLSQHTIIEGELRKSTVPVTFLRPGWFMENSSWDVAPAREQGVIPSFLQPLDKPVPMVATGDIGRLAAELLRAGSKEHHVVELEGPRRVTPHDIAATFSALLGRSVRMEAVPRDSWENLFRSQGMKNPMPRIRMLNGFNEEWIRFEGTARKGSTELATVLRSLVEASGQ